MNQNKFKFNAEGVVLLLDRNQIKGTGTLDYIEWPERCMVVVWPE